MAAVVAVIERLAGILAVVEQQVQVRVGKLVETELVVEALAV